MTPRPYLSWSSYNLFGQSPEKWKRRYLLGDTSFQTPAMTFGKKFAEMRETGDDEGIEHITMFLPKYAKREYEMTADIEIDGKKVKLLGKFDGVDLRKHIIGDDKTGQSPWTQARVDREEQLTWYALIYWKKKGVIPTLELNWIPTIKPLPSVDPNLIRVTGRVETFKTTRTHKDFVVLMSKISRRWRGILELCGNEWDKVL